MPTVELNGTSLYYEDSGPGSTGETIVFSHGLLWSTVMFAKQVEALRGRYRCVAWDHRGQGQSASDYRHCIGMELVTQDAIALLEHLKLGPAHFAGLSMGGFVGMRIAARRPDLVKKLILLETSSEPEPIDNVGRYRLLSNVVRAVGTWAVAKRATAIMVGKTILTDASRAAELDGHRKEMMKRRDIWRAVNGVIDRAGIHDELSRIRAPTLVVVGDEDVATPRPKAERIASAIAGATLVQIPRAGHSSPVEEPAAVTAALAQFLG